MYLGLELLEKNSEPTKVGVYHWYGVWCVWLVDHKLLLLALCMKLNHHFIIQIEFSMNHDCNNLVEQTSAFRPLIYDCRESSHWSMTLLERAVSPSSQLNYLYIYIYGINISYQTPIEIVNKMIEGKN